MRPDEIKRWDDIQKIIDGLFRRCLKAEAWNAAFYEYLGILGAHNSGKTPTEIRKLLRERQKAHYQAKLQNVEKKDPGLAAQIDDRNIEDVL